MSGPELDALHCRIVWRYQRDGPIIFVGYGFGGLIIKKVESLKDDFSIADQPVRLYSSRETGEAPVLMIKSGIAAPIW